MIKIPIESPVFAVFDQLNENNMYCKACSISFTSNSNLMNSIHNHLRTITHQETLHKFYNQHFHIEKECNDANPKKESSQLFSFKKATRLNKYDQKELLKYFDEKLKESFSESTLTTTSQKTYSCILRNFYNYLFLKGKGSFQQKDVIDFLIIQNHYDAKSALNWLLKKSGMDQNTMTNKFISKKLESQTNNQINTEILNLRNNFNRYFSRYIDNLEELNFKKLAILLILLASTELNIKDIIHIKLNEIKVGENFLIYKVKGITIQKCFHIDNDLNEKVILFLSEQNKQQIQTSKFNQEPVLRELQRELQQSKKRVLAQIQQDEHYHQFVNNLHLRHVQKQKLDIQKHNQIQSQFNDDEQEQKVFQDSQTQNKITSYQNNQNTQFISSNQKLKNQDKVQNKNGEPSLKINHHNENKIDQIIGFKKMAKKFGFSHTDTLRQTDEVIDVDEVCVEDVDKHQIIKQNQDDQDLSKFEIEKKTQEKI